MNFRCFFSFNVHIVYFACSQASLQLYSVCTKLMFDLTVCMLCNPAPPPFAVSKYASVTLPLKPVLCDKGCGLRRDWNTKFLWVTVPPVSGALIRNPPLVICKSGCGELWTQRQTWPPEKHLPLSPRLWKPHLWEWKIGRSVLNLGWSKAVHTCFRNTGNDTCRADCRCRSCCMTFGKLLYLSLPQPVEEAKASTLQGNAS